MKAEILLQKMLAQGYIQAMDTISQTYNEVIDDLNNFINIY